MRVFAIGDLHLPGGDDKPMNIFGDRWTGHFDKISANWRETADEDDVILIPGDISWAMQLENALPDLEAIGALPGKKILLRGNHDYWWSTVTRVRESLPEKMYALQNDAVLSAALPGDDDVSTDDFITALIEIGLYPPGSIFVIGHGVGVPPHRLPAVIGKREPLPILQIYVIRPFLPQFRR